MTAAVNDFDRASPETTAHPRWSRTRESDDFFSDEDGLRRTFHIIVALGAALLSLLGAGLWRLQRAALAPPRFVGVAHGQIFSGRPEGLASIHEDDFDSQLADTVEVLFGRTEKGLPPQMGDFCAPGVIAAVDRDYADAARKYPAGYVQTLALLESKTIESHPGQRRMRYRGLLASRSVSAAQTSPVYLDCRFVIGAPTPLNAVGWRLVRMDALTREDFYRNERERAVRRALSLSPAAGP